jgi:phosphoglycolate phosphatase
MIKPDAIVFDLDGTLLDTLESIATAYNTTLHEMGFAEHPIEDFRYIIGDGARVAAERCLPKNSQTTELLDACVDGFLSHYDKIWQTTGPYPGILNLLATIKDRFPLAVLSNKNHEFTQRCCDHFFPETFQCVQGYTPDLKHKPNPGGALKLIASLGASADNTWMVGDTATDMRTATASNMIGVGALWGFREERELADSGATHLIATPDDLTVLIDSL